MVGHEEGSPQGSVISPLLANIYLHYVFDHWVNEWRRKWAQGDVVVVRYADDIILGFQHRTEADRFLENLRERLGKFGLELHPDKTRRIEFGQICRTKPETQRGREAGNVRLPGLHAHQREERIRAIHGEAQDDPQAHAGQAAGDKAGTP